MELEFTKWHSVVRSWWLAKLEGLRTLAREVERAYDERNREKRRVAALARFHEDPQSFRDRNKQWKAANPEKAAENHRQWVANNRERANEIARLWRKKHPEKVKAYNKRSRTLHGKKYDKRKNEQNKKRKAIDPNFKLRGTIRCRRYGVLKGKRASASSLKLLGCSAQEFRTHLEKRFKPGMKWENHGTVWHVDHVKPGSRFDLTDPVQQAACFHYTNQQPLFAQENLEKGSKYG